MILSKTLKLVLDTNVVLDWLVFNDPALGWLTRAVQDGDAVIPTHPAALDELHRVLNYPTLKLDAHQQAAIYGHYQTLTTTAALPAGFSQQNLLTPAGFPQCRDRDDQLFLALAWHTQADALISRDKALLMLRKRAAKFGVKIIHAVQVNVLSSGK